MSRRVTITIGTLAALFVTAAASLVAQAPRPATRAGALAVDAAKVPRTPWGKPDLQGIWSRHTLTPLERPAAFADKEFFTEGEAEAFEKAAAAAGNVDENRESGESRSEREVGRAYNEFWWDHASKVAEGRRTSLIIDPPNGKRPPLTAQAQERAKLEPTRPVFRGNSAGGRGADSWLDRSTWERCITQGLPKLGHGYYNPNQQIFQTRDTVVILDEMIHEARVIPLDGRPHLADGVRQWLGNSRGRWDGDTLVIETRGLTDNINVFGAGENLRLTERYTRVDADTLLYQVTLTDPTTWTQPWTVQLPMGKATGDMYEYACHEGNRGLEGILSGARAQEKAKGVTPGSR